MDFKSLLSQLDQLNEATEKTKTGIKHTAEPGGYGRKDDEDEEGNKVKNTSAEKKGRGRPKKATQSSGEDKKYDFSAFGVKSGKDVKLPKHDKKKTIKHSLKEYLDQLDKALNEEYTTAPMPGAVQVKDASGKVVATAKNPAAAKAFQDGDITLGNPDEMEEGLGDIAHKVGGAVASGAKSVVDRVSGKTARDAEQARIQQRLASREPPSLASQLSRSSGNQNGVKDPHEYDRGQEYDRISSHNGRYGESADKDIGKHNNATTGFDAMVRKLTPKYGVKAAKRIAGAQLKKIREADMPPNDSLASPLSLEEGKKTVKKDDKAEKAGKKVTKDLEYDMKHKGKDDAKAEKAGKKVTKDIEYDEKKKKTVKEAAKPDFPDIDDDNNTKETISKAAQDAKRDKKKVKEGMDHRLKAARHMGKAHALTKEGYNCRYDDMEESRHYHEGYKEGLDECYGQMPVQGLVVGETGMPAATVPGMASQAQRGGMGEGNAFTGALAKTPQGSKFSVGGKTFTDRSSIEESPFAFEALEQQLNSLLESKEDVAEGMTVSISKGQQGSPDSVTVSAQDGEADQLLSAIKQAGLGLFGGDEQNGYGAPQGEQPQHGGLDVVGDHDGMMALIKKVGGGNAGAEEGSEDYADEEGHGDEHGHEGTCESCGGMMEAGHSCDEGQEMVDEVESEDQMEYEVAEEIDPNNSDEANEVNSDAVRDAALATAASTNEEEQVDEDEEEAEAEDDAQKLDEWANDAGKNGTDTTFEQDIDFMTKVISGGLNKQKSTGQSTIPVVSTQLNRLGNPMQESVDLLHDWRKLSGIK